MKLLYLKINNVQYVDWICNITIYKVTQAKP